MTMVCVQGGGLETEAVEVGVQTLDTGAGGGQESALAGAEFEAAIVVRLHVTVLVVFVVFRHAGWSCGEPNQELELTLTFDDEGEAAAILAEQATVKATATAFESEMSSGNPEQILRARAKFI